MGYETIFIHPADVLSQLPLISTCSITSEQEPRWQPQPQLQGCCAQLLLPSPAPLGALLPQLPGTGDSHAQRSQEGEKAARPQQGLCPSSSPSLCYRLNISTLPLLVHPRGSGCFHVHKTSVRSGRQRCQEQAEQIHFSPSIDTDSTFQMGKKLLN